MSWKSIEAKGMPADIAKLLYEELEKWTNEVQTAPDETTRTAVLGAIATAEYLAKSGAIGDDVPVLAQLFGHTNINHVAPEGVSKDVVQVLVRQIDPSEVPESEGETAETPAALPDVPGEPKAYAPTPGPAPDPNAEAEAADQAQADEETAARAKAQEDMAAAEAELAAANKPA